MVRELYPTAKKQMNITLKMFDENGKLNPDENYPVFVDWSNDFNKDSRTGRDDLCHEAVH